MIKAVLFDFDGTIVDSLKHIHSSWKEAFAKNNFLLSDDEIVRDVFYATKEERGKKFNIGVDVLHRDYFKLLQDTYSKLELQENIREVLEELKKRNIKTAILTSGKSAMVRKVLRSLRIEEMFDVVLGSEDVEKPKPHPDIAVQAMQLLAVIKEEAVMVGDSVIDIETGKNAEVVTGLYLPESNLSYAKRELLRKSKPDFEFLHFSDFLSILERF